MAVGPPVEEGRPYPPRSGLPLSHHRAGALPLDLLLVRAGQSSFCRFNQRRRRLSQRQRTVPGGSTRLRDRALLHHWHPARRSLRTATLRTHRRRGLSRACCLPAMRRQLVMIAAGIIQVILGVAAERRPLQSLRELSQAARRSCRTHFAFCLPFHKYFA
jgi:hypothetical protein